LFCFYRKILEVSALIYKNLGEVNFTVSVSESAIPYSTTLWVELDTFDRARVACVHCGREIMILAKILRENEIVSCDWCKYEQKSWDALLKIRPDILAAALAVPKKILIQQVQAKLERTFRGSGLKFSRR
jgi:hypothetical protein